MEFSGERIEIDFESFYEWWLKNKTEKTGLFSGLFQGGSSLLKNRRAKKKAQKLEKKQLEQQEKAEAEVKARRAAQLAFDMVDIDGSGSLDLAEIMVLAESLDIPMDQAEAEAVFQEMTEGSVDQSEVLFTQFYGWWSAQQAGGTEAGMFGRLFGSKKREEKKRQQEQEKVAAELNVKKAAQDAFNQIDADGSGSLDRDEIMALADSLGKPMDQDEAEAVFQEMTEGSVDKSEVLFAQFYGWWSAQQFEGTEVGMFGRLFGGKNRQEKKRQQEQEKVAADIQARLAAQSAFDQIDADGSGSLDLAEIMALAESLDIPMDQAEAEAVFQEMTEGSVDQSEVLFTQFYGWWSAQQAGGTEAGMFGRLFGSKKREEKKRQQEQEKEKQEQEEKVAADLKVRQAAQDAFNQIDADGSGSLDRDEIMALTDSLGKPMTQKEAGAIFQEMLTSVSDDALFVGGEHQGEGSDDGSSHGARPRNMDYTPKIWP